MWIETPGAGGTGATGPNSFASNGECGLKLATVRVLSTPPLKFIRQQWRMWIETAMPAPNPYKSPKFIRQQWRMWIETPRQAICSHPG